MKKYSIGLDIGTSSVGWSVIDPMTFKLIRKGNKNLWGSRLFEAGETAVSRRIARGTRRRYDRRRQRIKFVQEEFKSELKNVDPMFVTKLNSSFYSSKDIENIKFDLTDEEKQQLKDYSTIYHLRYDLMNSNEKKDLRLVYRAIHHIIKYRGNFLYEGDLKLDKIDITSNMQELFENIMTITNVSDYNMDLINYKEIEEAIMIKSITDKKATLKSLFIKVFKDSTPAELSKALAGSKFDIIKLLSLEIDDTKSMELSFKDSSFDDKCVEYESKLNEHFEIIEKLKAIYDYIFLKNLFNGKEEMSISKLMINSYDKHKTDIKFLKKILMGHKEEYTKIFKNVDKEVCLYEKYMHNSITYDEFKSSLTKIFNTIEIDSKDLKYLEEENEKESFLPKITDTSNGKYPYQLNKYELIKIIENQGKYYPFLLEKYDGKTYKLLRLLEFRIPYYVGPLNTTTNVKDKSNKNSWIIKHEEYIHEKITPYNFEQVVNLEASAKEFIERMLSNCTYLMEEKTIPASSILYSKFKVLNELKQISINGDKLSVENVMKIYNGLFLKLNKTITLKDLEKYVRANELVYSNNSEYLIKGFSADNKFANNMRSYIDFFGEDGFFKNTNYLSIDADEIIKLITIFEDKKILFKSIENKYLDLNTDVIERICKKRYTGWSNLSSKLLTELSYIEPSCNVGKSIMDLMEETNENFMQIITKEKYNFQKQIDNENIKNLSAKLSYETVGKLATSPANKKGIYQALKIVNELIDYMGYEPDNISIEMARSEDEKARKSSKHDYLKKVYAGLKNEIDNYKQLSKELNDVNNDMLNNSERLFLYFIQEGKSLYSGQRLSIDSLELYEVDHIIPRTLVKDDSKDNKALVLKEENQLKGSTLNVPNEFKTSANFKWWKSLLDKKLISSKKYYRLLKKEYTDEDVKGFINRQLVETRQICKHIATILNKMYENTEIVYLHADLSSNFRKKYQLYKFRAINDHHHAHDAYLSAVLGSYKKHCLYDFDQNKLKFLKLDNNNNKNSYGYVLNSIDYNEYIEYKQTGEAILTTKEFIDRVSNTLYQNDCIISRKTEIKTGELYNQTKNKKGGNGVPLKDNLPVDLYGAYTKLDTSYGVVVKYAKKNKESQRLIGIPIYYSVKSMHNRNLLDTYIRQTLKLSDNDTVEIIKDKIQLYSEIKISQIIKTNGEEKTITKHCILASLSSKGAELWNGKQFYFSKEKYAKWKYTLNKLFNNSKMEYYYINNNKYTINEIYENQLDEIIEYILSKIATEHQIYYEKLDKLYKIKLNNVNSIEQKEYFIKQLLQMLQCNSLNANFKPFASVDRFGRLSCQSISGAYIYSSSVTGVKQTAFSFNSLKEEK